MCDIRGSNKYILDVFMFRVQLWCGIPRLEFAPKSTGLRVYTVRDIFRTCTSKMTAKCLVAYARIRAGVTEIKVSALEYLRVHM